MESVLAQDIFPVLAGKAKVRVLISYDTETAPDYITPYLTALEKEEIRTGKFLEEETPPKNLLEVRAVGVKKQENVPTSNPPTMMFTRSFKRNILRQMVSRVLSAGLKKRIKLILKIR